MKINFLKRKNSKNEFISNFDLKELIDNKQEEKDLFYTIFNTRYFLY